MEPQGSRKIVKERELANFVFSWSLEDILNEDLFKDKVERIPNSFESIEHYLSSFVYPFLEDTRAELSSKMGSISSAPFSKVISIRKQPRKLYYDITFEEWTIGSGGVDKEPYRIKFGDIILFTNAKPDQIFDLRRLGSNWSMGFVTRMFGNDNVYSNFVVRTSTELQTEQDLFKKPFYAVFLMNMTTAYRIWSALHSNRKLDVIKELLGPNSMVQERCELCPPGMKEMLEANLSLPSNLNRSQREAVLECLSKSKCDHMSSLELIWGPPGTGKTRCLSVLLFSLLRLKCRTLICAPTNVAILEVASRVMKLVKESGGHFNDGNGTSLCSSENILLYGNVNQTAYDIEDICLTYRVERLKECLEAGSGWKHCFTAMKECLENCISQCENFSDNKGNSFLEFARDRFVAAALSLRKCISIINTHLPKTFILAQQFQELMRLLGVFETSLFQTNLDGEELKDAILLEERIKTSLHGDVNISTFLHIKSECIQLLRTLLHSLEGLPLPEPNKDSIEEFCFNSASLIFCTASSSYKLHSMTMYPVKLLVVDEAAQLKECESLIPLQVLDIKHAVLLGDECQLPSFVSSKVSAEAGFCKSLFERLSSLGYSRHCLDTQYRMQPEISSFPNTKFYQNRIMDAEIVKSDNYKKCYIPGSMYGPYSFMNISCGRELADGHSWKNLVEVAVLLKILQLLYKACDAAKLKVTIGVISPYSAQVSEIQRKLGQKYGNHDNFKVHVRSIDGFQGGEEDIVIISSVRSNQRGLIGFSSSPQRTNVALTRARHCLWILGNEKTLCNSDSVWEDLILDAKVRKCFFNADEDKDLQKVIMEVKKDLGQLDDMLNADSTLFRNARWKLTFSENFTRSFPKLESAETKNLVLFFLSKLAGGWRPKRSISVVTSKSSLKFLKQYKIGRYKILYSVDIYKESWYTQTLKVWDILAPQDIPKMIKRLDHIFVMYTEDYISRCGAKCFQGNLEVPMTWPASADIVQYKTFCDKTIQSSNTDDDGLDESPLENSKVRESLLLMKFYSLSTGAISNLLSGCDGETIGLPFELTDQERDIVLFEKSSFILGRSGTGKTTVLTMKLFQNDQRYHLASEGYHEVCKDPTLNMRCLYESKDGVNGDVLRQLFVTVSPRLCYAVRHQLSKLKSGDSSAHCSMILSDVDKDTQSPEIPDSFSDLPPNIYPLVITFSKFLMMLDGTHGFSYFDRFPVVRQSSYRGTDKSRSVALETFVRTKEVNYERFNSSYWPHFNKHLTQNLDSLSVFTEIMSVIKGGLQETDDDNGMLCQNYYVSLSNRGSMLSMEKRKIVYKIFTDYEKVKKNNGDYDLADLVIDLHRRLKGIRFKGNEMDFVFIDEVQDLSVRQIALFKYICKNVDDGFAFSGDTAQAMAKGINFRFEDIRYLFYREFLGQDVNVSDKRNGKGKISRMFHLNSNFRTHAGILKLAQSVIDLLYHFFPFSIDFLKPETSLVSGEPPILIETDNMNALRTIFKDTRTSDGGVIAFGAEQVILVRDDCLKKQICEYVGKNALVLTIFECKGLEFEDVLLYNFFSSSPFQRNWRLIYGYMNTKCLLGSTTTSFPSFDLEKHGVLCSELKHLYVALTRTKQRLWICENIKEFCGPMFDYWKKLCVASVRQLDDSFIKEIQVDSIEEDWKSRGIKLFYENNYGMAKMCFEKAGDRYWVKLAEASQYQEAARISDSNSEMSRTYLSKAAEIFDAIGKHESAALLFFEIHEYERAGYIYMCKLGEPELDKAGECFCLAKCFKEAAKVYASGRLYSECLSACKFGKLYDKGLQYVQEWLQKGILCGSNMVGFDQDVQEFLQNGAVHYYELSYYRKMREFVNLFQSKDCIRIFLKNINFSRDLLDFEIRWGNYLEAARIAKMLGECLLQADLLSKGGIFQEASMLMLWYVFSNLTRSIRSKYGSSYQFKEKDEILKKAIVIAKNHSDNFYEFVCMEADILSKEEGVGELLESALKFVRQWKQYGPVGLVKNSSELDKTEQELLENCASHYCDMKDSKSMMKFVEDFQSIDLMRGFLKNANCLDELLFLEEREGNFLEAAEIAGRKGDLLRKSDLLMKSENYKEASIVILWYVFFESLWNNGSRGWPLKEFAQKEELLDKAIGSAEKHSHNFFLFVRREASLLSNEEINLSELIHYLFAPQVQISLRSVILACRRILDAHINSLPSMYKWNGGWVNHSRTHFEDTISQNRVSVETFVFLWEYWKDKILELMEHLCCKHSQATDKHMNLEDFILNYFGVQQEYHKQEIVYAVLNSDVKWVREINPNLLNRSRYLVSLSAHHFVRAARNHLVSELVSVGMKVLGTLQSLYTYCQSSSLSVFHQSLCLVHMFEIAKFLENYEFPNGKYGGSRAVQKYLKLALEDFYGNVFHIDWKRSMSKEMIFLRGVEASVNSLKEAIFGSTHVMNLATSLQAGRQVVGILGSGKHTLYLNDTILKHFDGNQLWMEFIEEIHRTKMSELRSDSSFIDMDDASKGVYLMYSIFAVLKDICAHWRPKLDCISPSSFLYLAERLLIMDSCFRGYFFVTTSSCVEWLIYEEWNVYSSFISSSPTDIPMVIGDIHNVLALQIQNLLLNKHDTLQWIKSSYNESEEYFPLLVLRLVVLLCIICINSGGHFDKLYSLLDKTDISSELPSAFCHALMRSDCYFIDAVADALMSIGNPLVIVSLMENFKECSCSNAIFLSMKGNKFSMNDLVAELFPETFATSATHGHNEGQMQYGLFSWEILDTLESLEHENGSCLTQFMSTAPLIKVEVDKISNLLSSTIAFSHKTSRELSIETNLMVDELNQLSYVLDIRQLCNEKIQTAVRISKALKSRKLKLKPFLDDFVLQMQMQYIRQTNDAQSS